jgi:hypothetical protein
VALVYEAGLANTKFISRTMNAVIKEAVDHRIASIDFLNKNHPAAIPLQAADFLAHAIGTNEFKWIKELTDSKKLYPPLNMPADKLKETSKKLERLLLEQRRLRKNARKQGDQNQLVNS